MATNSASTKRAFNVREFCTEYGIGHDGVYKAIREGKLIARKYGKRTIITADDAERFIAALPRLELPTAERDENSQDDRKNAAEAMRSPAAAN